MVSPTAEEQGEEVGGGEGVGRERKEKWSKSTVEAMAPKVPSKLRAGMAMSEAPRISPLGSENGQRSRDAQLQRRHSRVYWLPCWHCQSNNDQPKNLKESVDAL